MGEEQGNQSPAQPDVVQALGTSLQEPESLPTTETVPETSLPTQENFQISDNSQVETKEEREVKEAESANGLVLQSLPAKSTKINRMILEGFKSFGKRTELIFSKGFNCVLGPNGSGKSNILDAICFVLGKSSSKQLRAETSANLIYNGGKSKQPAKQAEVSIVFDNNQSIFPVPEPEVKLSRIVRKDGQSVYKINSKTRTRQEVVDLLNFAKIDPDGYNVILQGDITHFVKMSSVERRQIVEEIAGIGIYEEKKGQALNELGHVEMKLGEAATILKEREGFLKDLHKDREQALKYKGLNDGIRQNKATHLKRQLEIKEKEKTGIGEKSSGIKKKFSHLQEKIRNLRDEIQKNKEQIQKLEEEVRQKGTTEQQGLQKAVEELRISIATKKTRITGCQNELDRITARKESLRHTLEELDTKLGELHTIKGNLSGRSRGIEKEIAIIEHKVSEFKKKHNIDQDTAELDQNIESLDKQAEEKARQVQQLSEQRQNLLREKDKIDFQLQTIDQQIQKVKDLEKEHEQEMLQLKQRKEEFKKAMLELNSLLNEDSRQASEIARSRERLQKAQEELAKIEVRNAGIQESINANIAVKKVLENRKQLGEIYGTVAELGHAPQKYSTALEVAASQKIQSIVVEDDKTAAKCIRFLKDNKFGIATFLPLNKISGGPIKSEVKALAKEKGVHGLAIELISFEPKFKEVFGYVFGNTLVVDTIEVARKLGIGRAKMVTLEGDLTELSGAMIGGYRQKRQGAFKEQELSTNLEKLQEDVAELQETIASLEQKRKVNEESITKLRQFKADLEGEIIKQEKGLHIDESDFEASKSYKEDLQKRQKAITKELDQLIETISTENRGLADLKIKRQELRNKVMELRNPTLLAELNAFEQKKRELVEERIKTGGELKNVDLQVTESVGKDRENIQRVLKELEKEHGDFQSESKQLDAAVKDEEKALKAREQEQTRFQSQFQELFAQRSKLDGTIAESEKKLFISEQDSRTEELKLNTFAIEEARINAEVAGLGAEFGQYEGVELALDKGDEQLRKEIADFEKMRENIGNVNMRALDIYDAAEKEYQGLLEKKNTLVKEKDDVLKLIDEVEGRKKELFLQTLLQVQEHFQRIFSQLHSKGSVAALELEDPEAVFNGGLIIRVKIAGEKFLDLRSLSGGEMTLTALALIFALQEFEPASFYVLDEVDAALDKRNSQKLADLVRKYCDNAQYVVISHNDAVIAEGDTLYGVSMNEHGVSNVVSLKLGA